MDWLVAEPHTCCFLHYSGHGGQVPDLGGDRASGFDDTIVPVDYAVNGQLDSSLLHRHLVSRLPPSSTLFAIFDCCHSGSVIELPFVYRSDAQGNVSLMEKVDAGLDLIDGAKHLIRGPASMRTVDEARALYGESKTFFQGLLHGSEKKVAGLGPAGFKEHWEREKKMVTLFSGCRDDQISSDTRVEGVMEGAMTWAFLEVMRTVPNPTYVQVRPGGFIPSSCREDADYLQTLKDCRATLKRSKYAQIPQLSVGMKFELHEPLLI